MTDEGDTEKEGDDQHQGGMGQRGVTRPMAEMHGGHSGGGMSHDDREQMLRMHHQQTLWVYWTLPFSASGHWPHRSHSDTPTPHSGSNRAVVAAHGGANPHIMSCARG